MLIFLIFLHILPLIFLHHRLTGCENRREAASNPVPTDAAAFDLKGTETS
jgi:hypothetical protein